MKHYIGFDQINVVMLVNVRRKSIFMRVIPDPDEAEWMANLAVGNQ
jgi:hypothetical protein